MPIGEDIALRFKEFAEKKMFEERLSQVEFAENTGINYTTFNQILNDKRKPSVKDVDRLVKTYPEASDLFKSNKVEERSVPYYNVDVFATSAPNMEDIKALEPEYYIPIPVFRQADFAVRVRGDSMYPKFRHGDIIICKHITNTEFILYGEVYLVITKSDNLRTVKYLQANPEDADSLMLIPYNKEVFQSQAIPKDEIQSLFLVLGSISEV